MKRNGTALIGRIFKITFQSTGIYAVLAPLYYLIEGLFPAVETMVYAMLFDGAAAWITGGHTGENGKQLWIMAGILVVLSLFRGGLNVIGSIAINIGIYERLPAFLNQKLAEKCARLSMIDFENSEIYDQCLRARECLKREQISALYMILAVLFSCILSAASSGAVLASYSPVIIPLAFLSVIPYFVGFRLLGQKFYRMQKSQTPARREAEYFWKTLTKPESVRELRMAGAVEYMEEKWMVQNRKMQRELYDYRKREACCILLCDVIQVAGIGASIGLTLYLAVKGADQHRRIRRMHQRLFPAAGQGRRILHGIRQASGKDKLCIRLFFLYGTERRGMGKRADGAFSGGDRIERSFLPVSQCRKDGGGRGKSDHPEGREHSHRRREWKREDHSHQIDCRTV